MKALIYTRVSLDRAGGRSVQEQEAESRRVCEANGWDVVDVVTDSVGASRHSKGHRDGWDRARKLLEQGAVDVLVTWEASRAQRDLAAYAALRDLCASTQTKWSYSGRTHDLAVADDRFRTGLDALLAEREADETSERVQRAMRANAANGRPHGRRLYGYRRIYDEDNGRLIGQEAHPDEAPVVRRIFAAYLEGLGMRTIANELNAAGHRTATGARWSDIQVRRVLQRPSYAARRVHRGEVVGPADWPALVDEETFDRVQARLAERAGIAVKQTPRARLLAGIGRCGECGSRLVGNRTREGRAVYQCRTSFCVTRGQLQVDAYVTAVVLARLKRADAGEALRGAPDPRRQEMRQEVAALRERLSDAVAQFTAGHLTGATLARVEADLLEKIADAERRLRHAAIPLDIDVPADNLDDWWDELGDERRREVVAALVSAVVIHKTQRGTRRFDPSAVAIEWRQ